MTAAPPRWSIERHASVDSTMDLASERAIAGASEGTVVLADRQTAGRGRAGRRWETPPGVALMLTAILRPNVPADRLGPLALVAGVALAEAVEGETGLACWLKWPNDLWLGGRLEGRKAAGILVSARLGASGVDHVLLGIGLNVLTAPADLPPGATSLAVELAREGRVLGGGDGPKAGEDPRERILVALLDRLAEGYAGFVASGGSPLLEPWLRRAALLGEAVEVEANGEPTRGTFVGLRADGALLLRGDDGVEEAVVAGDLVRGPRYRPGPGAERSDR